MDAYVEAGGNLIDTANVYVGGTAEKVVGRWFAARPSELADRIVLATKGRFGDDSIDRMLSACRAERRTARSTNHSNGSGNGPADYFIGAVRVDPLFDADDPNTASAALVTFEPGARSAWHTHPPPHEPYRHPGNSQRQGRRVDGESDG